jgi:hypothetical protein
MKLSGFMSDYTQRKAPPSSSGLFHFDGIIVDRLNTIEQMSTLIRKDNLRKQKGESVSNSFSIEFNLNPHVFLSPLCVLRYEPIVIMTISQRLAYATACASLMPQWQQLSGGTAVEHKSVDRSSGAGSARDLRFLDESV